MDFFPFNRIFSTSDLLALFFFQWLETDGNGKAKDNQFPLRMKRVRSRETNRHKDIHRKRVRNVDGEKQRVIDTGEDIQRLLA